MDKAALGTKRVCPGCGARFYDLNKLPIVCPKCGHSFDPETMFKGRRNRSDDESKDQAKVNTGMQPDEDENEDISLDDEDESEEAGIDEVDDSDDHDEDPHHDDSVDADDVTIDGIDDDDDDNASDDDDDTLLEPDDDDDDDVSGIIDADINKDEG